MIDTLTLAIDVGTGSVRAALVDAAGVMVGIASREHEQIVPRFGWSEQRPDDWWSGAVAVIRTVLGAVERARDRIETVAICGQMHGTVLVGADGRPTRATVPLWNDKRTADLVATFERSADAPAALPLTGNPPTPAWPAFKLAWLRDNDPGAYRAAAAVLMPKDYVNLRLTGELATDWTEASLSFLMDPATRAWSADMTARLGLDLGKLPPIRSPLDILGGVSAAAGRETGLRPGTPVLVGAGDYPVSQLGSGVCRPGWGSDVTGTSAIVSIIAGAPLLHPEICNVASVDGLWSPFVLLETGGDGMRWARRALHDNNLGYGEIVERAASAAPGSDALFFLPYLSGERLGRHRNARAQFFGLGAAHGSAHLNRAVMEGVAFALARQIRVMERACGRPLERVVASGGGAKTALWLKIKASVYGIPIAVPREPECGVVGCAVMAAAATGRLGLIEAADRFARMSDDVVPDPAWAEVYARMQPVFDRLYIHAQGFYDDLDAILRPPEPAAPQGNRVKLWSLPHPEPGA